jgi:hypothetical protein
LRIRGRAELFKVPDRTAYKSGVSERVVAITESSGTKRLALLKRSLSSSYHNCVVCPFDLDNSPACEWVPFLRAINGGSKWDYV